MRHSLYYLFATLFLLCTPLSAQAANVIAQAEAKMGEWLWIPRDDMMCRDGSKTGIGVRLQNNAAGTLIFLQGGGYCGDAKSCRENANTGFAGANFGPLKFYNWAKTMGQRGVFNITTPKNPLMIWNHVYIPYCTGDVHAGTTPNVRVPGMVNTQHFLGRTNYRNALNIIAPYFQSTGDVVLMGSSAGAIGTLFNYGRTVKAFGNRSVALISDSAPIIPASDIKPECFYRTMIDTFKIAMPGDCTECSDLSNYYNYLARKFPQGRFGLMTHDADLAGVIIYNEKSKACGGAGVNIFNYKRSVFDLRKKIGHTWATFLPGGVHHTMAQDDNMFLKERWGHGVSAAQWLVQINAPKPYHVPE